MITFLRCTLVWFCMLCLFVGCSPEGADEGGNKDTSALCDELGGDEDGDGTCELIDNCPGLANNQNDYDYDGIGDACDYESSSKCDGYGGDLDRDNVCDAWDVCPTVSDPGQMDSDGDGQGNACDDTPMPCDELGGDGDEDGACEHVDNCPGVANNQADFDYDGIGDACDDMRSLECDGDGGDEDQDNVCDAWDVCPNVSDPGQMDSDGDGQGDVCDSTPFPCDEMGGDEDGDGACELIDNCPGVANNQADFDHDGIGDACDDATYIPDEHRACAGLGGDVDLDDFCGLYDNCPYVFNQDQRDGDGDGIGDACDVEECDGIDNDGDNLADEGFSDDDDDGLADCVDDCPEDPLNDPDEDDICGLDDNCPTVSNDGQDDEDGDGQGDACEMELPTGNWPTPGGTKGRRSHVEGTIFFPDAEHTWTYSVPDTLHPYQGVSNGEVLAVSSRYNMWVINVDSGQLEWMHSFGNNYVGGASIDGDHLYIAQGNSSNAQLFKFELDTGFVLETTPMYAQWETYYAPLVLDDAVVSNCGTYGGICSWTKTPLESVWFNGSLAQYDEWSPSYDGQNIFAWVGGELSVIDPDTGDILWEMELPYDWHGWSMNSYPVLDSDHAFVTTGGALYVVDTLTQEIAWNVGSNVQGFAAVDAEEAYIVTEYNLQVRNVVDGSILWTHPATDGETFSGTPVLTDDWVIFTGTRGTYGVHRTNQQVVLLTNKTGQLLLDNHGFYLLDDKEIHHFAWVLWR